MARSHSMFGRAFGNAFGTASVVASALALLGVASSLGGCPIYGEDSCRGERCYGPVEDTGTFDEGTDTSSDAPTGCSPGCAPGYACDFTTSAPKCVATDCRAPERACAPTESCERSEAGVYACTPKVIDCSVTGCISGYSCATVAPGKRGCVSSDPLACSVDSECVGKTGAGSLCLGGVCKAPKDLCLDSTECRDKSACADGRCVPKCGASCAAGYACDAKTGLCTDGKGTCSDVKTCAAGSSCVASRCVEPCATDGACKVGLVCVAGGCVVDDRPNFFCDKDGTKDGTQDVCAAGSICLRHNCYIACTGPTDTKSCDAVKDRFPVCKSVLSPSGKTVQVCGSATNLGTECDPTATPPKSCASGKFCIDGFCK